MVFSKKSFNRVSTLKRIVFLVLSILSSCQNDNSETLSLFELLDAKTTGITFENRLTYTEDFNTYLFRSFYNGAGTGLADFNNDGFLDVFFCGNQVDNKMYLGNGNFEFKDVTESAGVDSKYAWSTGVSIVDIDQDGWLDVYVCKSGDPKDKNRRNELFVNTGVNKKGIPIFKESAKEYGIDDLGFSVHAVFFDYDKDNDLDMYLSNNSINPSDLVIDVKKGVREVQDGEGGDKLYRNDAGHFTNVSKEAGIYSSVIGFGLGIAISDIDRDGWPDIYVANDFFEKDYLYLNNQDGTFTESIDELVPELSLGSMGVDIADMNHDGYPEIFVTEMLPSSEARLKTKAVFDGWDQFKRKEKNGYHRQYPRNAFQLNNGLDPNKKVSFSEISRYSGVSATDWSWGVQMVDFDLDGTNEVFVTNGIPKDLLDQDYIDFYNDPKKVRNILEREGAVIKKLIDNIPTQPMANCVFKEKGDLKFEDVASQWGMAQPGFSSGAAYGDIDNDGDLDLVVNNIDAPPFVYRNNVDKKGHNFIGISVKNEHGADAIGTQVTVVADGNHYYKELFPMRGVMSAVDPRLNFGLGNATVIDTITVTWPDGKHTVQTDIGANQFISISKDNQPSTPSSENTEVAANQGLSISKIEESLVSVDDTVIGKAKTPLSLTHPLSLAKPAGAEQKTVLSHTTRPPVTYVHHESDFNDFNSEKLTYQMISNEGPKLSVADIDDDGDDDFYIGGAKGSPGALYFQDKTGFKKSDQPAIYGDSLAEDTHSLFFDADGDTDLDLIVAGGGPEFSINSFALIDRLYLNDGKGNFTKSAQILPDGQPSSTSVVIHGDFDSDGDDDLFFGGRTLPGSYGVPASSYILENDGKANFKNRTEAIAPDLLNMGMVTDAVWSDFDDDNDLDLIIVGEWMPIRIFANNQGTFEEVTEQMGLSGTYGFWNTIIKKDLDGDGREDLIAGNMGENTFFKASVERPVQMYVNDFDQNGDVEQVITVYNGDTAYPLAQKKELTSQLPYLLKKYMKYTDYAAQKITDIFSEEQLKNALTYKVNTTSSMVFWNDGGTFSPQKLPMAAQLASVYSIFADNLGDDEDVELFLGGNQFRAKPQTGGYGGSYGTVIKVSTNREFEVLKSAESGLHINGEIRDIKKIASNKGTYLVFARNNDSIQWYAINK